MKRAVICSANPEKLIDQVLDYSIMIIDPNATLARRDYLLEKSDYSLLITDQGHTERSGGDYGNECLLWYTSGTTGDSKFCSFTQEQRDTMSATIARSYNITNNDRYVGIMPLWHAHGQGFYWATKFAQCETNFTNIKDIKSIPKYSPTFITAIPSFLKLLIKFEFDSLRFIRGASSALPEDLYHALVDRYRVPVVEAFGMTEAMSHCFTNPLQAEQRPGTVGLPDGIDADIRNGVLHIKGPCLSYSGWYDTGDLAEQDSAGYYRILGRARDQINVHGIKVNPLSLENQMLRKLSGVTECVVFGSDKIKCLYTGTCDTDTVVKFLASLGSHCRPKIVQAVDSIPIGPSGKLSRAWLDNQYT